MGIIGSIRKHSGIAVAVVGIAIVAFIIGDLAKNNRGVPDMGQIDDQTITYNRFNEKVEEMENSYKAQQGIAQIPTDVEYQLRDQVWQNLVTETLTDKEFDKLGLQLTPAELNDMYMGTFIHPYIRQIFTDPQTGNFNPATVLMLGITKPPTTRITIRISNALSLNFSVAAFSGSVNK